MKRGLIGSRKGTSGVLNPDDNISLVKSESDLRKYVYNEKSETNIVGVTVITDLYVNSDETKVYLANATSDYVQQYNLSGTDVTYDYYNISSFFVGGQDSIPQDLFFKPDGTTVYIVGSTSDAIYQYSLGTAWDVSTASYAGVGNSFSVASQETEARGLFFRDDGTRAYIVGQTSDAIYQYTLSTPWNISTASYAGVGNSFSVLAQDTSSQSIFFKPDGTKVYLAASTGNRIYQYSLGTPWDISTASYENKSLPTTTVDTGVTGIYFKSDGTRLYVSGQTGDAIYQLTLSIPWDITTATYDTKFFYIAFEGTLTGVFFKDDGTSVYAVGTAQRTIYQYPLSTAWDIAEVNQVPKYFVGQYDTNLSALSFKPDGSTLYFCGTGLQRIFQLPLRTDWDVTSGVKSRSFYIGFQDGTAQDLYFKPDGTSVYIIGSTNDRIYQYNLGTAWDITTASHPGIGNSFSVAAQEGEARGIFFRDNGTRAYIVGQTNDRVFQYDLGTPWDITTASYAGIGNSFSVLTQDTTSESLYFKSDGSTFYMLGSTGDRIYQYSLGTAWDISTASYDNKSLSVTSQETSPVGITFKPDGTKVYMIGTVNDTIFQYSLSTPWDVSTGTYDNVSLNILAFEATPSGVGFNSEGTKVYVIGTAADRIFEFELKTAWDITSAVRSALVGTQDGSPQAIFFKPDGTKVYVLGNTGDSIYQYTLSTAWDVQTATYDNKFLYIGNYDIVPTGLHFTSNGEKIYIMGQTNDRVNTISLATPWDISTAILYSKTFSVGVQETVPTALSFKPDGTRAYIVGQTSDAVYQYNLGTAWDITTASYAGIGNSFSILAQETTSAGLFFKPDGTRFYLLGQTSDRIHQYTIGTPWDISTASYAGIGNSFSVLAQDTTAQGIFFKPDGTTVFMVGSTADAVFQYSLGTPWDISTASYSGKSFSVTAQDGGPVELFFKSDGTKLYIAGSNNQAIYSYTLPIAWDISTAVYDGKPFFVENTGPHGLFFKPDGTKIYVLSLTSSDVISEYELETPWTLNQNYPSLYVGLQDGASQGLQVTDSLNKIYMVGSTRPALYQYELLD